MRVITAVIRSFPAGFGICAAVFAATFAVAQDTGATEEAPPPPKPKPVTCSWNGASAQHDANCSGTEQRQVLTCSDGSSRIGKCVGG